MPCIFQRFKGLENIAFFVINVDLNTCIFQILMWKVKKFRKYLKFL